MVLDPYFSHGQAGLQNAFLKQQQEVTRPMARFKPTLTKKSGVDGGATRCQRILVSCFTWTPLGDLVHQISLTFIALVRSSKLTIYVCSCFFTLLNYLDCECKLVHQSQFWKQTLSHIQTLWLRASSESQNIDRGSSSRSPSRRTQLRCSMPLFGLSGKFHPS